MKFAPIIKFTISSTSTLKSNGISIRDSLADYFSGIQEDWKRRKKPRRDKPAGALIS